MAKKKKIESFTEVIIKPIITKQEVIDLAKDKEFSGFESIYEIQAWIRDKHHLHSEIFYSLFHKKWSINNYFIDTIKGKRVEWNALSDQFDTHDDALITALYHLLNKI